MREKAEFKNSKGDKLVGVLSSPAGIKDVPIMILCHGFASSKESSSYVHLEQELNDMNIATFRFDFYGHGESDGKFEDVTVTEAIDDTNRAIDYVKDQSFEKVGILGASFGGFTALLTSANRDDLSVVVLKAPVSNWKAKIEDLGPSSYEGYEDLEEKGYCHFLSGKGSKLRLNKTFFDDAFKYDGFKQAKNISAPTLVVHGTEDKSVPVEHSGKIAEILPNGKLYIIEGADHGFSDDNDYEKTISVIVEFIRDNFIP